MLSELEPRYDVKVVAQRYGVVPRTVIRWIEKKLLRAIQPEPGGPYRIPASALNEFEVKHTVGGVLDAATTSEERDLPPASNE